MRGNSSPEHERPCQGCGTIYAQRWLEDGLCRKCRKDCDVCVHESNKPDGVCRECDDDHTKFSTYEEDLEFDWVILLAWFNKNPILNADSGKVMFGEWKWNAAKWLVHGTEELAETYRETAEKENPGWVVFKQKITLPDPDAGKDKKEDDPK